MTTTVTVKEASHDIAVTAVDAPSKATKGEGVTVDVSTENQGTYKETFTLTLTDTTDSVTIGSKSITLSAGGSTTTTFSWDTSVSTSGEHILTAEASAVPEEMDTADNYMTATVTVVEGQVMHVANIDMWYEKAGKSGNNFVYTKVQIVDSGGNPVSGATVHIELALPDGSVATGSGDTTSDGTATFKYGPTESGAYTATVKDVTKDGWTYDPSQNVETNASLEIP